MTDSRSTVLAAIGLSLLLVGCAGGTAEWTAAPASAEVSGSPGSSGDPGASGGPASPVASGSALPSGSAPTGSPPAGSPSASASGSPAPSPGASVPGGSPAASQPPDSGNVEITIGTDEGQELLFVPDAAEAPSGAAVTLTFQNVSQAPHNLTFSDPIDAATQTIVAPGASETLEFTAPEAGDYTFVCTLHPGMDGVLTVTE